MVSLTLTPRFFRRDHLTVFCASASSLSSLSKLATDRADELDDVKGPDDDALSLLPADDDDDTLESTEDLCLRTFSSKSVVLRDSLSVLTTRSDVGGTYVSTRA